MSYPGRSGRLEDVHVAGWTIVQVACDLDSAASRVLESHVDPLLVHGARVAIDLRRAVIDPVRTPAAILTLTVRAGGVGAHVAVVESDARKREQLRAAGVPDVYESLDAAVHVTTPVLRRAAGPRPEPPLIPASGDVWLPDTHVTDVATP
jgi:hypothetical protein